MNWKMLDCRKTLAAVLLTVVLCMPLPAVAFAPTVEITEVKVAGVSAADESKSILQVLWRVNQQPGVTLKSFEVVVDVTYADGGTEKLKASAGNSARSVRFEVATLHRIPGRPPAELKSYQASITAILTETSTKQSSF